jgi:hypothetical protein
MPAALSPVVTNEICHQIAAGEPVRDVAAKHGIARETCSRLKSANKERIIQLASRIMEQSSETVFNNHIKTLQLANGVLNKDPQAIADMTAMGLEAKDLLKLSDTKEYRTLQIMGIIPSNTQSVIVQNIFGDIAVNMVDPGVRQLLGGQLDQLEDIQDAEVVE